MGLPGASGGLPGPATNQSKKSRNLKLARFNAATHLLSRCRELTAPRTLRPLARHYSAELKGHRKLVRIQPGIFDFEPDLGLTLGRIKPKISGSVPTNQHTTIPNGSGTISACFDDDLKLLRMDKSDCLGELTQNASRCRCSWSVLTPGPGTCELSETFEL